MIGLGILGLVKGDFAPIWQPVPKRLPGREVLAYLSAVVSLASGVSLLWPRAALGAARVLLVYSLLWLVLLRVPLMFFTFTVDVWWASCKTAVMVSSTWLLYASLATHVNGRRLGFAADERGVRIARGLYGLAMIPFGVAHFLYLKVTADLVPGWLPWHVFWACFTGVSFIAAGAAVLIGVCARLAATLSALQIGMFTLLVWVPIVVAGPNPFQWSEVVVSLVLTAGALVVADSYRGAPWLAAGTRGAYGPL